MNYFNQGQMASMEVWNENIFILSYQDDCEINLTATKNLIFYTDL